MQLTWQVVYSQLVLPGQKKYEIHCCLSYAGPTAWNSLPAHLHQISDTSLFKRRLKTELFHRAYRR